MTLSDRIIIEQGLNQQMTFKSIAASIEKDPSSISKEIRRYLLWSGEDPVPYKGNDCVHYKTCTIDMLCMWDCPGYCKDCDRKGCNYYCNLFESASCGRLESAPYVCNGCPAVGSCHKTHRFYSAEKAQQRYSELLVSSASKRFNRNTPRAFSHTKAGRELCLRRRFHHSFLYPENSRPANTAHFTDANNMIPFSGQLYRLHKSQSGIFRLAVY